ncbi:uncharacterized protein LOC113344070 [Papaver somniferum]|uniref:uncharacterized protein LOC113344070 n=1 Tax=Papaver somniferum TaxID=3469 RepID=UPI000E6F4BE9|nr:uncharacterized protein LOC113344070 [Papaver somniferum]
MRVFFWNAQGLAKDGAKAKLKELQNLHSPDIICLAETQVFCTVRFVKSLRLVGFCEDVITNEVVGTKGNIWILWRNTLPKPTVISSSKQAITIDVDGNFITAVHASFNAVSRKMLWSQLGLGSISIPWLVVGDFNCVLRLEEKKGGIPNKEVYMIDFRNWISDNGLVEADAIGKKYTWSNCQKGRRRIVSKHDRALVNNAWHYKFANWRCKALPRICSDHSPLIGFDFHSSRPVRAPFRFQKMWQSHPSFLNMVENNWNQNMAGAPPFVFNGKLKRLKDALKSWNRLVFGDVHYRLKQAELRLDSEADLLDFDPADEVQFTRVEDARKAADDVRLELASMLRMKSRISWLEEGDQNTRFFHNSIRLRRGQNTISELKISSNSTLTVQEDIRDFIIDHYKEKFNGGNVNINPSLFDYPHASISTSESASMDVVPSLEDIKEAVFDLGADSAPGPDGFPGSFYRHCWNIISEDLYKAIVNCWEMRMIPKGINSSFMVLIPKNKKSDAIKDYRPIGLSNFFFKIITKIMATRLGSVLDDLVSEEQVAFMKGRNIHENIALAAELTNELNSDRKYGNVGIKLDIAQAFDTVSWDFIIEVFRQYGFSETWCTWIRSILDSARISILINGSPEGFFSISRGLRQGDPLSPLIFVLIEDVLSRNLSKLFARRSMHWMVSKKGVAPTHLLFADDILVFCRGNWQSLRNLVDILNIYKMASGQCVNFAKSKFYYGGGSASRAIAISNFLGMERAHFPDRYLGINLKPGIVRHIHIRQVVEKIMDKLAGWKGQLLSFQARLVLIKSVISSYVTHSMAVYKWPCTAIKRVERAIRNFLWSGDADKRKYFTVLFESLCCPKKEGGLGLKKLLDVNKAMLMKLWVSIRDSDKIWARFLRAKFFKNNGNLIDYKLGSSVFPGIKLVFKFVQKHTRSIIGNGENTSLFFDNWCGDFSIAGKLGLSSKGPKDFQAKVSDITKDGSWVIPPSTRSLMVLCGIDMEKLPIIPGGEDYRIWDLDKKGVFSVKSAKAAIKASGEIQPAAILFNRKTVHPTLGVQYWKIWMGQCCATEDKMIKNTGRCMPSMCRLCRRDCESLNHITWHCRFAKRGWVWLTGLFNINPKEDLVNSYKAAKGRSRMIKDLWLVANLAITTELWKTRNRNYFDNAPVTWLGFKGRVYQIIRDNSSRMKGHMHNTQDDLRILNYFRVQHRSCKINIPVEISWTPPNPEEILICCDGASLGNPGQAGSGVIFRDSSSTVLGTLSVGLGWQTNFYAEVAAVIYGAIVVQKWDIKNLCIRSDSMSCIQAFQKNELPWQLRQKWLMASRFFSNIRYVHSYREVNFSADALAKRACLIAEDIFEFYEGRPAFIPSVEWPGILYYRFK